MPLLDPLGALSIALFGLSAVPNLKFIRWICGLALIVYQAYVIYRPYPPMTIKFHIYFNALSFSLNILFYCDHAIINNAFFLHKQKGQEHSSTKMPFSQRLKWSADIMSTYRGVNWSWEIPHLRRSTRSRWLFVQRQLFHGLVCVIASDVLRLLRTLSPAWQVNSDEGFGSQGFIWQIYNVAIFWSSLASMQLFMHCFASMITVAIGIYEPGDWPALYGDLKGTKSIRMFWG